MQRKIVKLFLNRILLANELSFLWAGRTWPCLLVTSLDVSVYFSFKTRGTRLYLGEKLKDRHCSLSWRPRAWWADVRVHEVHFPTTPKLEFMFY